jgi:hypothetical protein
MTTRKTLSHEEDPRARLMIRDVRPIGPIPSKPMNLGRDLPKRSSGMMTEILI